MQKIIILIFLILTFICSCSEKNKTASDWLEKEKALWDGKQYTDPKKAIKYLNNAIKLEPNNARPIPKGEMLILTSASISKPSRISIRLSV